jgi:predicted nucleotidyltransferase
MSDEDMISALQACLEQQPGICLGILFGSVASGAARADSDIDIAILQNHPMSVAEKTALIEKIALLCGRPVDLIDLATAGEPLLGEILKGKRLTGSNESFARLMTKHLLDVADFLPLQQRILKERRDAWIK